MKSLNVFKPGRLEIRLFALLFFLAATTGHAQAASLELYGTFHAMGVIVELKTSEDPDPSTYFITPAMLSSPETTASISRLHATGR